MPLPTFNTAGAALAAFALLGGISLPTHAAPTYVSSSDLVVGVINASGQCAGGAQHIQFNGTGNVPTASCFGTTFSATAQASAAYGSLRALADLRFNHFDFAPDTNTALFEAKATARTSDTLTFSSGKFWEFTVAVSGQSVFINNGKSYDMNVGWCFNPFGAGCGISGYGVQSFGTQTFKYPIPANGVVQLTPDLTIDITMDMRRNSQGDAPPYLPLTTDNYADLSHTVRFVSSRVLDANGAPIDGATITSASGFDYVNPPQVPEPAAWASLTAGLAVLSIRQRRRAA